MAMFDNATLIGLDWGTTSLRAHLIGSDGMLLDTIQSQEGIMSPEGKDFVKTFERVVGPWLSKYPNLPVIASGMITSRNGWLETPYLPLPAGPSGFANALTCFNINDTQKIYFVTGASYKSDAGDPDIMRGEEVQILGCLQENNGPKEIFLLPGTHSKWAIALSGTIESFMSFMTGEIYALLNNHSILGTLATPNKKPLSDGFLNGVKRRFGSNSSLLHQVFSARTLALFDQLPSDEISDFISGLLIGDEVKSAITEFNIAASETVHIIGRGDLAEKYSMALDAVNVSNKIASEHAAATGLYQIAKGARII
ncbi:MAG: 2-dehydro-3-deoxygalactonokinase [Kordiimonadaceae bacterium]|jgi:2-dehydro-3-deoxygalactonokinase|nr:2-dehydro-3-deoxygalactonokinase [Kordiimonadaceae bacterium]MBT6328466.1 2-dehydro-3-deoxygalactonokinase [Kordiimonadaceae bacterium]MBT7605492.1 2-dehydro-3-deoxygalactonokinase [Kordiimonadaceae bacterium]